MNHFEFTIDHIFTLHVCYEFNVNEYKYEYDINMNTIDKQKNFIYRLERDNYL